MAEDDKKKSQSSNNARPAKMSDIQKRAEAMANRKPVAPGQFFKEAWVELQKTTWPTKDVLVKSTTVVLAFVGAVAVWVGAVDMIMTRVVTVFNSFLPSIRAALHL